MIGIDRVGLEALLAPQGKGADAGAVAREFEAHLLGEIMKFGSKPMMQDTILDGGDAGRMFRDYFFQEIVRQASRAGQLGLAGLLRQEIEPVESDANRDGEGA